MMSSTRLVPCDIYPKNHRARREDEECGECEPGSYWLETSFEPPATWRPDSDVWGFSYGWRDPSDKYISNEDARSRFPQYIVTRYRPTIVALDAARERRAKRAAEEKARLFGRSVPRPVEPTGAGSVDVHITTTHYPESKERARAARVAAIRQWVTQNKYQGGFSDAELERLDGHAGRLWHRDLGPRPADLD